MNKATHEAALVDFNEKMKSVFDQALAIQGTRSGGYNHHDTPLTYVPGPGGYLTVLAIKLKRVENCIAHAKELEEKLQHTWRGEDLKTEIDALYRQALDNLLDMMNYSAFEVVLTRTQLQEWPEKSEAEKEQSSLRHQAINFVKEGRVREIKVERVVHPCFCGPMDEEHLVHNQRSVYRTTIEVESRD